MLSLILATKGHRKAEIIRFIKSIKDSSKTLYELIIVSQDEESYLDDLKTLYADFPIQIINSDPGLSKARNIGINVAQGEFIAFPDDDCVYTENLIENIKLFFESNSAIDIVTIDCYDLKNERKLPFVSINHPRMLSKEDIFKGVSSISVFHRANKNVFFDEKFGLGAQYKSSEEFDYVIRLMKNDFKLFYTSEFRVLHPNNNNLPFLNILKKVKTNSIGHGAFIKKNIQYLGIYTGLKTVIMLPFAGFIFYLFTLRFKRSLFSLISLFSRIKGLVSYAN